MSFPNLVLFVAAIAISIVASALVESFLEGIIPGALKRFPWLLRYGIIFLVICVLVAALATSFADRIAPEVFATPTDVNASPTRVSSNSTQVPKAVDVVGRVTDLDSGRVIDIAKVSLDYLGAPSFVYTDRNGVFAFQLVEPDSRQTVHLRVEKSGYDLYEQLIVVPLVDTRPLDIRLVPQSQRALTPVPATVVSSLPTVVETTTLPPHTSTSVPTFTPAPPQPTAKRTPVEFIIFDSQRDGPREIYRMDLDGTNVRRLTFLNAQSGLPACSNDGRYVTFVSDLGYEAQRPFLMNMDGSDPHPLNESVYSTLYPSWSPDSEHIAYALWDPKGADSVVAVFGLDGSVTRLLPGTFPGWSPDGSLIAFETGLIEIMNANGRPLRVLTQPGYWSGQPAWSPDGGRIAFLSDRDGTQIYSMKADGSDVRQLTKGPGLKHRPFWSPDGKKVVFASDRTGNWDIYMMNADGSNVVQLTNSPENDVMPAWCVTP